MERVIIHVDMDAFFAAIEQRDDRSLRSRPVVVGADPKGGRGRGVVSTCSYEAREYGVHSAMPISEAWRRCPHAAFLPVSGDKYGREAECIRELLHEFTPQTEFVSIDEGYLDVTASLRLFGGKRRIARAIRDRIEAATGLTASIGVAPNKLVAKIASDLEKPRGLVIVEPDQVAAFLRPLRVGRLPGVGPKMREALAGMGVRTIGDLMALPLDLLRERFGEHGDELRRKALGRDDSPVRGGGEARSIGHEHTFELDTDDAEELSITMMRLCEKVARRLRKAQRAGRTVTTKVRFKDFITLTRRRTVEAPLSEATALYEVAMANLRAARMGGRKVRLIGVQISGLTVAGPGGGPRQTSLFGAGAAAGREDLHRRIARAEDAVMDRFGEDALRRGLSLLSREREESDEDAEG